jgi:hypothetical protein
LKEFKVMSVTVVKQKKSNKTTTNRCLGRFSFTICYDYISSRWFLKKKCPSEGPFYRNHIWISSKHINETRSQTTPEVEKTIMNLVKNGSSISSIQIFIRVLHGVNVSTQTIF